MARISLTHQSACFVCEGPGNPRIDGGFEWDDEVLQVFGRAVLGPACQGAPGHAHGGSLFAILDEAMGMAAWYSGHKVLTAHMEIDYRRPVRLNTELQIHARVERVEGRKVWTLGELLIADTVVTEAKGLFIAADKHDWDVWG